MQRGGAVEGDRLRPGRATAGCCSKIAIALRALTSERMPFWANSKKVRIGPTMKRP